MTPQSTTQGSTSNQHHNNVPHQSISNTNTPQNSNQQHQNLHQKANQASHLPSLSSGAASQQHTSNTFQTASSRQQASGQSAPIGQHQQQLQALTPSATIPQSSSIGLAGTGGAGGGSGGTGPGTSLTKIVTAQLSLLLSTLKENNYEQQAAVIRTLLESNSMEVYHKFIRRLVSSHAQTIFSPIGKPPDPQSSYRILNQHIKALANSPESARTKFAECISASDNDVFRDFDLATFMRHFDLDALERSILALGFKSSNKADLRSKAHDILAASFSSLLETLANPAKHQDLPTQSIALFLQQYFSDPVPSFLDNTAKLSLSYAARTDRKSVV